jgi:hypothetical protein
MGISGIIIGAILYAADFISLRMRGLMLSRRHFWPSPIPRYLNCGSTVSISLRGGGFSMSDPRPAETPAYGAAFMLTVSIFQDIDGVNMAIGKK